MGDVYALMSDKVT